MVRDPARMALSSFLYHSQRPTPEEWVWNHFPCRSSDEMRNMSDVLGVRGGALLDMCNRISTRGFRPDPAEKPCEAGERDAIGPDGEKKTCWRTMEQPRCCCCPEWSNYYARIAEQTRHSERDALRLETARFAMSSGIGAGGDLVRMP